MYVVFCINSDKKLFLSGQSKVFALHLSANITLVCTQGFFGAEHVDSLLFGE